MTAPEKLESSNDLLLLSKSEKVTDAVWFVTTVTYPGKYAVPIFSIRGILFTSPWLWQESGGTKNIPWFASLPIPPIPCQAYTFFEVLT